MLFNKVKRIHLVEDEILIRSSLARALRKDGYVVYEARDYAEAVENLKNESCDLAIVDLYLEDGMHGIELIREIHHWYPEAKIIIVSAFGTEKVKEAAGMEGIDCFYDKPFEITAIRKAIGDLLYEYERIDERGGNGLFKF